MAVSQPASNVWYIQDLVQRANQQDQPAFTELYERYAPRIHSYLQQRLKGNSHEADDLTSEVFAKVYEKMGGYQFRGLPFSAWLFRIARNQLIDHVRSAGRQPQVPLEAAAELRGPTSGVFNRRLDHQQLGPALSQLTDEQRQVIVCRFVEGMSLAETARVVGKGEEAVKKLQARGLAALKRAMACQSGCWQVTVR